MVLADRFQKRFLVAALQLGQFHSYADGQKTYLYVFLHLIAQSFYQ
jgi:hypothetical protein